MGQANVFNEGIRFHPSEEKVSLRSAAYALASRRFSEAAAAQGTREYFNPEKAGGSP